VKHFNIKNIVLCLVALWMTIITLFVVDNMFDIAILQKQSDNHKAWLSYFGMNINGDEQIPKPKEVR
jgi:hypothetical protein